MRILHTEASCGWGGQEIRILTEAQGMIARGHEVSLVCPSEACIYREAERFGVPATALPIQRKSLAGLRAMRRYLFGLRTPPIDIVNAHSSTDSWLAALAMVGTPAGLSQPTLVRTRHVSAAVPNNLTSRWLYRRASQMVVTTGAALREQLIRDNGLSAEAVVSVPTGIDLARYQPPRAEQRQAARAALVRAPGCFVVGIVATLRSWKGHRYLVEAVEAMLRAAPQRAILLVIVGDGPQRRLLEQLVAERQLGASVHFAGNQNDVVPYLHALDAFALPSYANEGVPQALLQAMACGVPVVTTDAGAIGEIALPDKTALVVARQDVQALAGALETLRADPLRAARLADAARQRVQAHHSLDGMLDAMQRVFCCALEHGRRGRKDG